MIQYLYKRRFEIKTEKIHCSLPLLLCHPLVQALLILKNKYSITVCEHRRIEIIVHLHESSSSLPELARQLGCDVKTARFWYRRSYTFNSKFEEQLQWCLVEPGHAGMELRTLKLARKLLEDAPRSGRPLTYSAKDYADILTVALRDPGEFNRPISQWTSRELADEVKDECQISARQIGRFLSEIDLKPHQFRYWLTPTINDPVEHENRVKAVCDTYELAKNLPPDTHVASTDEKTGIQAKERIHLDKPVICGSIARLEAEYKRHGTLCLIPSFDVSTGQIITYRISETRTEFDFIDHITKTVNTDPHATWVFVLDQLNTHASESLVRFVAERIGYTGDLGKKGRKGILETLKGRQQFLEDPSHRIRFVFTPKHCSWLNQVEIWFSVLVRKLLKRGSFTSKEHLQTKLEEFITYFNRTLAKPYNWTYKGKLLQS